MIDTLISIIIPTYNRAHLISETLESVMSQTYKKWECIIVDDGSTDNTPEILSEYVENDRRFKYHKRPNNILKGPNSCRNFGYQLSKGDFIQFFDSDDIMKKDCLETKLSFFSNNTDVVVCKLSLYDFEKKIELRENKILSKNLLCDYFTGKIALYVSGPLWNKKFLDSKTLLFDESVINCDDWDFNMRMLYFDPKVVFLDQSLILYRIHTESLSSGMLNYNFDEIKKVSNLLDKHLSFIKSKDSGNLKKYYTYLIDFNKYYLKQAILKKHKMQFFLLRRIANYFFLKILNNTK